MFTIEQIQVIHSKVKSGADFPQYIQELILLGVLRYTIYVDSGRTVYLGKNNFMISSNIQYPLLQITSVVNKGKLEQALKIHQQGLTDYLTFCRQAADSGVSKWVVDMASMTCSYYDQQGNVLIAENIPEVQ